MARDFDTATERDPKVKGSYRRRLDDAYRALEGLELGRFPPEAAFIFYYLVCEKVAKVMIGISRRKPAAGTDAAARNFRKIRTRSDHLRRACAKLKHRISLREIEQIFSDTPGSACRLRNQIVHDIGPTHVLQIQRSAAPMIENMRKFLNSREAIIGYLRERPVS